MADDTKIVQVDRSSGESRVLYQVEAVISRMFVVNDKKAYFIQNGNAYCYDFEAEELMALQETGDVQSVIPTPYGEIYERGKPSTGMFMPERIRYSMIFISVTRRMAI